MGVALFPVFQETPADPKAMVDGKALARNASRLDRMAEEAGVPLLNDLVSMDPGDLADAEDDELFESASVDPEDAALASAHTWFDAAEGLRTVRALLQRLRNDPAGIQDTEATMEDLAECERQLAAAAERGERFHFEYEI